ncbi:MAG: hypothetical protein WBF64_05675 [Xanthobacteraceae bacterium]
MLTLGPVRHDVERALETGVRVAAAGVLSAAAPGRASTPQFEGVAKTPLLTRPLRLKSRGKLQPGESGFACGLVRGHFVVSVELLIHLPF